VFPKILLLHKVVRDAKKVEKHWFIADTKVHSMNTHTLQNAG